MHEPIAHRIKAARLAAGLTQLDAANAVGCHVTRWSSWERGIEPRLQSLGKIAKVLGVTVSYLVIPPKEN